MVAVNAPVARYLSCLCIILLATYVMLSGKSHAMDGTGENFQVTTSTTQVELGKPIYLELMTNRDSPSLAQVDLAPLQNDFVINQTGEIERELSAGGQKLRLRIYSRVTGKHRLPALVFEGDMSNPQYIEVMQARDPKDNSPIDVRFEFSERPVWLKQQYLVKALFSTKAEVMVLDLPKPDLEGFHALVLHTRSMGEPARKHDVNVFETGWALYADRAGEHTLELPAIRYIRDGVTTHLFYPPRLDIKVRPLPVYLPGTIAVGRFSVSVDAPIYPVLLKQKLNQYQIEIRSKGTMAQDVPELHTLLRNGQAIKNYVASREQTRLSNAGGVQYHTRYTLPFAVNESGLFALPEIHLQYFDPDVGKLSTVKIDAHHYLVVSPWLYYPVLVILLVIIIFLLLRLLKHLIRMLVLVMTYYRVLGSIRRASHAQEIKSALLRIADAEGWPVNLTLLQWQQRWNLRFPQLTQGALAIKLLYKQLYSGKQVELEPVKQDLLRMIVSRMFVLRLLGGAGGLFNLT